MAQGILMLWLFIIPVLVYASLLLYIAGYLKKITPEPSASTGNYLSLSVVTACRNEEKNITGLLDALASQEYPRHLFEVIIVDDNSSDATFSLAKEFRDLGNLKVIRSTGRGKKAAQGTGIINASFPLIVTTDADCRMGPLWLSSIAGFFLKHHPGMIIGPVNLPVNDRFTDTFQQIEWAALQGITAGTAAAGNPVLCNGANLAFTGDAYMKHSGNLKNKLASGDDIFLLQSLKTEKNVKIMWLQSTEATVTTPAAGSLKALLNQRARWVSKSGGYRDPFTILLAIVTFAANLSLPVLFSLAFLRDDCTFLLPAIAFTVKVSADLYFLIHSFIILRISKPRKFPVRLFFSEILYPLYILIVALKSIGRSGRW